VFDFISASTSVPFIQLVIIQSLSAYHNWRTVSKLNMHCMEIKNVFQSHDCKQMLPGIFWFENKFDRPV